MNLPAQNGAETCNQGKGLMCYPVWDSALCPPKEKSPQVTSLIPSWDSPCAAGTYLFISPQVQGQVLSLQFGNMRTTIYVLVWNITRGARQGRGEPSVSESFRSVSWFNKQNVEVPVVFVPSCFL